MVKPSREASTTATLASPSINADTLLINGKLLLTVDEAAECLSIGRSHLYGYVIRGEIRSVTLGRRRLIPVYGLVEFVERLNAETVE